MRETNPDDLPPAWRRFLEPISSARMRRSAWLDVLFRDLGIFRLFWRNKGTLSPRGFRSNQPFPWTVRRAAQMGVRSILNARHDAVRHGGHALVRETAEAAGMSYQVLSEFPVFSRTAPSREAILKAAHILETLPKPVLIHCKSGADRAGFLSAMFLIVVESQPVRLAKDALSLRHLHLKGSRTGVLDAVFDAYLAAHADEAKPFLDWVREDYDNEALNASYRPALMADLLDRFVLRRE